MSTETTTHTPPAETARDAVLALGRECHPDASIGYDNRSGLVYLQVPAATPLNKPGEFYAATFGLLLAMLRGHLGREA